MKNIVNAALALACTLSFSAAMAQGQAAITSHGARATAQWHRPLPVENFFRDRGRFVGPYNYFRDRGHYVVPYHHVHRGYPRFHTGTRPGMWHHHGPVRPLPVVGVSRQAQVVAVRTPNVQAVAIRVNQHVVARGGVGGRR